MRQSLRIIIGLITACVRVLPATGSQRNQETCSNRSENVTGFVGLSVSIQCTYPFTLKNNKKEFCKVNGDKCSNIISSYTSSTTRRGRFLLTDHKPDLYRVTISELTEDDSGRYLCRVYESDTQTGCWTEVTLAVKKFDEVKPTVFTGVLGGHAAITCSYHNSHKADEKCLCKGADPHTCEVQKIIPDRDFLRSNYFRVIIKNLKEEDVGSYWCCSNTTWRHGFFQIQLSHSESHQRKGKSNSRSRKVTEAPEKREGSGTRSPGIRNIPKVISAVVSVLSVVTLAVILYKLFSTKTGRSAEIQDSSRHGFKESREAHQYEEISEQPCAQSSGSQLTTVYVTVNHSEENLHYAFVRFQKNSDDKVE